VRRYPVLLVSLGVVSFVTTLALENHRHDLWGGGHQAAATFIAAAGAGPALLLPDLPVHASWSGEPAVVPSAQQQAASHLPATPEAVPSQAPTVAPPEVTSLQSVIENEADVRSRLSAVNSLRSIGLSGDDSGHVRAALRAAMNDPNPNVKGNAEQAYEMVAMKYEQAQ
jgi:hypothetical protein